MTPNQNEELRERIIEAVPEIVELKFGCEIRLPLSEFIDIENYPGEKNERVIATVIRYDEGGCYGGEGGGDCEGDFLRTNCDEWNITKDIEDCNFDDKDDSGFIEIIGRPIQLADVLRVIEKNKVKGYVSPSLKRLSEFWEVQKLINYWNLAADLDGQTDEVKEFLWKIICSPK